MVLTLWHTLDKRITVIANVTTTDWTMIHNHTLGIESTSTRTRINALLIDARLVVRAFRTDHTIGLAVWWGSFVVRQACANPTFLDQSTLTVWSTRGGCATILLGSIVRDCEIGGMIV